MHKGRGYPYHWYFWGTECFFWPGFVPWEMMLRFSLNSTFPWNALNDQWPRPSSPGQYVPDYTQMYWNIQLSIDCPWEWIIISVEQETINGKTYAVWAVTLHTLLITSDPVWFFEPSPLYVVAPGPGPWWKVHDPLAAPDGPILTFSPSTWAEINVQPHS